ncbi:MAG: hypothetical protein KJ946_15155, partial [Gammaproteobacteria bacterium]|nr:hypothetical protein [Gammaproteobacteria bacterium]
MPRFARNDELGRGTPASKRRQAAREIDRNRDKTTTMCGITGIFDTRSVNEISRELLHRMNE